MNFAVMVERDSINFNPMDSFNPVASTSTSTPTTESTNYNSGVKRSASEVEVDELESPKENKATRKRNRTALSCSECKRRLVNFYFFRIKTNKNTKINTADIFLHFLSIYLPD